MTRVREENSVNLCHCDMRNRENENIRENNDIINENVPNNLHPGTVQNAIHLNFDVQNCVQQNFDLSNCTVHESTKVYDQARGSRHCEVNMDSVSNKVCFCDKMRRGISEVSTSKQSAASKMCVFNENCRCGDGARPFAIYDGKIDIDYRL